MLDSVSGGRKIINFDTEAAIEYWGPLSQNLGKRQRVYDTFFRATQATRGWGWSDWWNNRYINMHCNDIEKEKGKPGCRTNGVAYTYTPEEAGKYPDIVFCPHFSIRQLQRNTVNAITITSALKVLHNDKRKIPLGCRLGDSWR